LLLGLRKKKLVVLGFNPEVVSRLSINSELETSSGALGAPSTKFFELLLVLS